MLTDSSERLRCHLVVFIVGQFFPVGGASPALVGPVWDVVTVIDRITSHRAHKGDCNYQKEGHDYRLDDRQSRYFLR